ncbi:hypothetical protein B0H10DRAFT_1959973 [Mycena sp. CBHHK59/15]|nr:hypothetical protein B0H10DRAFT_1959973 [Mycena sp. CBHHK59/15]
MWRRPLSRALQRSAVEYHPELVAGHASDATAFIDIQQMLQAPSSWSSTTTGHNSPSQTTNVVHKFILTASTEQQFEFWVPEKLTVIIIQGFASPSQQDAANRGENSPSSFLLPPSAPPPSPSKHAAKRNEQQTRRETKRAYLASRVRRLCLAPHIQRTSSRVPAHHKHAAKPGEKAPLMCVASLHCGSVDKMNENFENWCWLDVNRVDDNIRKALCYILDFVVERHRTEWHRKIRRRAIASLKYVAP